MLIVKDIRVDTSSGTFPFIVATVEDGSKYQVKLPNYETYSMTNEYIANKIANNISCRVPKSNFLLFDESNILFALKLILDSKNLYKNIFADYDIKKLMNTNNDIVLFGIEFLEDKVVIPEDEDEFNLYFEKNNDKQFYSLYSFDLYLHNHDRHCKNIMFKSNEDIYLLIDHDKIFGTDSGLQRFQELIDDFGCIRNPKNEFLYRIIKTEEQKRLIISYSKEIEQIKDENIENIFNDYLDKSNKSLYNFKNEEKFVSEFLKYRKTKIVFALEKNCEDYYG